MKLFLYIIVYLIGLAAWGMASFLLFTIINHDILCLLGVVFGAAWWFLLSALYYWEED